MNYYDVLEVKVTATQEDIKIAYRKAAVKHHPDRNKGKSSEKMIEVNKAYETLGNPDKRRMYDLTQPSHRTSEPKHGPFWNGDRGTYQNSADRDPFGFDYNQDFTNMWEDMMNGFRRTQQQSSTSSSSTFKRHKLSVVRIKRVLRQEIENKKIYVAYTNATCDLCSSIIHIGDEFYFLYEKQKMCKACQKDIISHL